MRPQDQAFMATTVDLLKKRRTKTHYLWQAKQLSPRKTQLSQGYEDLSVDVTVFASDTNVKICIVTTNLFMLKATISSVMKVMGPLDLRVA